MIILKNQTLYQCEYCYKTYIEERTIKRHERICGEKEMLKAELIRWYPFRTYKELRSMLGVDVIVLVQWARELGLPRKAG